MLAEVEAYETAYAAAADAQRVRQREILREWEAGDMTPNAQRAAEQAMRETYRAERDAALAHLHGSSDPLVQWIAKNPFVSNRDYALEILRALPATLDELQELADANGWCSDFGRWRERAELAGVTAHLPESTSQPELVELRREVVSTFGTGEGTNRVMRAARAAVEAAVKAALEAQKSAPDASASEVESSPEAVSVA